MIYRQLELFLYYQKNIALDKICYKSEDYKKSYR